MISYESEMYTLFTDRSDAALDVLKKRGIPTATLAPGRAHETVQAQPPHVLETGSALPTTLRDLNWIQKFLHIDLFGELYL